MFIFGLHLISDDRPSDPSNKHQPKCEKGPLSPQKLKCLFLDYVQFLMINRAIQVMNIDQNVKKGPLSHQKIKCSILDYIQFLTISQTI